MEIITSVQNPLIKSLQKLRAPSARRAQGVFLAEGYKLCEEALRCGLKVTHCLYCDGDARAMEIAARCKGAKLLQVTEPIIAKLSEASSPQKMVMAVKMPDRSFGDPKGRLVMALDGISDPANFGTILRTAEAFGVSDILCDTSTVDLYNTKVLRGAMGSSFRIRVHEGFLPEMLLQMKQRGYKVLASLLDERAESAKDIDTLQNTVLVIGNEAHGVSDAVRDLSDGAVMIPMTGQNESLNAGIAAAVFMWKFFETNI